MNRKKQQELDAIADEIIMLAKGLKSAATAGTARELEMESIDASCTNYQCVMMANGPAE